MYKLNGFKENAKLITIAIPTFNRASYLDLCLCQIYSQIQGYENLINIIVSDNCSSDNTSEIIDKYIKKGFKITYLRSDKNNGMDVNFLECFNAANSKYVWIFSDDDVLLDGGMRKIIEVLLSGEYGIIYLRSYAYNKNYLIEKPKDLRTGYDIFYLKKSFMRFENYFFTFITGNIVNKSLVNLDIDINLFVGGNLVQVVWELSAFVNSTQDVYIRDAIIGSKDNNSGGYAIYEVFGKGFEKILKYFDERGSSREYFRIMRNRLVSVFLPVLIRRERVAKAVTFEEDKCFETLYPLFKRHIGFWLFIYPMIRLPIELTIVPFMIVRVFNRLLRLLNFISIMFGIFSGKIKRCKYKSV